ncbi:MAG: transcriptional regulator [Candidatus Hepatoplasma scabrum]|nr:MAG: transcriptional regulator [Candidatus Hepatoplasma sp.]
MNNKKICQSCGMPLKKDKNGPAKEKDGSPSEKYCSNCYKNGEFTCPKCTVEDIKNKNKEEMKKRHFPNFMVNMYNKKLPELERWHNNTKKDSQEIIEQ